MKVLLVTPSYAPIVGGTENFVKQLANALNNLGIRADVLTFCMNKKWKPYHRSTIYRGSFLVYRISAIANPFCFFPINPLQLVTRTNVFPNLAFTKLIKSYDLIHFCDEEDLTFPLYSIMVKKPKIMHSLTPNAYASIKGNFFQRIIFKKVSDWFIPCSYQIPSYLEMGVNSSRIKDLISVGVDTEYFKPRDKITRQDSLLLFVGRLQRIKGVHVLLRSLTKLHIPVHLVIIGPFQDNDPEYTAELKNAAEDVNSEGKHKVELLGSKNEKELLLWYQKATILVAPHIDGICGGLTTLEALACATPVIATGDEVVQNNVTGLIVPRGDAGKLTEAIELLLGNKILREKFGFQGRRLIETHYSWRRISLEMSALYRELLKQKCMLKVNHK